MNADVEKAVDGCADKCRRIQENRDYWHSVSEEYRMSLFDAKQALRDQEAEIARLRTIEEERWSVVAMRNAAVERAEKAEALLRELEPILRNSEDYEDREIETYASRITAHLGAEQ